MLLKGISVHFKIWFMQGLFLNTDACWKASNLILLHLFAQLQKKKKKNRREPKKMRRTETVIWGNKYQEWQIIKREKEFRVKSISVGLRRWNSKAQKRETARRQDEKIKKSIKYLSLFRPTDVHICTYRGWPPTVLQSAAGLISLGAFPLQLISGF